MGIKQISTCSLCNGCDSFVSLIRSKHLNTLIALSTLFFLCYNTAKECDLETEKFLKRCGFCEKSCTGDNTDPFCVSSDSQICRLSCECRDNYRRHNGECVPTEQCDSLLSCAVEGSDFPIAVRIEINPKVLNLDYTPCINMCTQHS